MVSYIPVSGSCSAPHFLLHHYGSHCTERYHCTQPHKKHETHRSCCVALLYVFQICLFHDNLPDCSSVPDNNTATPVPPGASHSCTSDHFYQAPDTERCSPSSCLSPFHAQDDTALTHGTHNQTSPPSRTSSEDAHTCSAPSHRYGFSCICCATIALICSSGTDGYCCLNSLYAALF